MRDMNISFLSLVGACSIPTHGFLVRPIRSAIILLTVQIKSPGLIGSGGCAVFYTISRFKNSVFHQRNTSYKCGKHTSDIKFPLPNLHLKPVSLEWNPWHFAAGKFLTERAHRSKTRQLNKVALIKESCTRTITGKCLRFKAILFAVDFLQIHTYLQLDWC